MMTLKENSLAALRHETYDFVPSNFDHLMAGCGAGPGPAIEKGPAGGGKDGFGVVWVPTASGGGAHVADPSCHFMDSEHIVDWKKIVTIPDPSRFDWETPAKWDLTHMGNPDEMAVEYGCGNGPFERLVSIMGFEEALMALALEPEACIDLMNAVIDFKIDCMEYIKKYYKADIYTNYDDIATEQCTFMSPAVYRECIKPMHKRLNDAAIAHGMIPMQHTCGKAEQLVEDFMETGAAAWTSVQPTNDIEGMLKKYGRKFVFSGGFDSTGRPGQQEASAEEVDEEIHRCLDTYGPYPGFMFFGCRIANSLDPREGQKMIFPIINEVAEYRSRITVNFD